MQWSLFLLTLMGQCSFFTCCLYEYHFIKQNKSWSEAQSYCRDHYTDLATVLDETDVERLRDSAQNHGGAWIGLHHQSNTNRTWYWSQPGVEFNETNWDENEPNDHDSVRENCVMMDDEKWKNGPCNKERRFICYDGKNKKLRLIHDRKTWPEAQKHCREHHTDLVSGLQQLNKLDDDMKGEDDVWIGLFGDTWRWSSGSGSSFRNWDLQSFKDEGNEACAVTGLDGRWSSDECNETKPFFCYDDKVILINESKTWDGALKYCRDHHTDLVSITTTHQQSWVEKRAKKAGTQRVWMGLRYTCTLDLWFWVSDELVCYENWAPGEKPEWCDRAAAMNGEGKWTVEADSDLFDFICAY